MLTYINYGIFNIIYAELHVLMALGAIGLFCLICGLVAKVVSLFN
jgi:hypothetical protein